MAIKISMAKDRYNASPEGILDRVLGNAYTIRHDRHVDTFNLHPKAWGFWRTFFSTNPSYVRWSNDKARIVGVKDIEEGWKIATALERAVGGDYIVKEM